MNVGTTQKVMGLLGLLISEMDIKALRLKFGFENVEGFRMSDV